MCLVTDKIYEKKCQVFSEQKKETEQNFTK